MKNAVFAKVLTEFAVFLGAPVELESRNGFRFNSSKRGKATVYHNEIAVGNSAEIAFEPESLCKAIGISRSELIAHIESMKRLTGRPVETNPTYRWPRVGFDSLESVERVVEMFRERYRGQ